MKQNLNKILLGLVTMSILSSNAFAVPVLATTKPVLTVKGTIAPIASLALGLNTANSGQAQTLTFPMVTGVIETKYMDGTQGGGGSGLVISDNDHNGYSLKMDSTFGGKMKGSSTGVFINYTFNIIGIIMSSIPLTSAGAPATIYGEGLGSELSDNTYLMSASHAALPSTQAADVYTDAVTFYLYSL